MEKTVTGLGPKEEYRPVLLDTLAAMHVTCNMFLMHCLISASPIMISAFKKSTF